PELRSSAVSFSRVYIPSTSLTDCLLSFPLTYSASKTTMTRFPVYALYSAKSSINRLRASPISFSLSLFNSSHAPITLYPSTTSTSISFHLADFFFDKFHTSISQLQRRHSKKESTLPSGFERSNRISLSQAD